MTVAVRSTRMQASLRGISCYVIRVAVFLSQTCFTFLFENNGCNHPFAEFCLRIFLILQIAQMPVCSSVDSTCDLTEESVQSCALVLAIALAECLLSTDLIHNQSLKDACFLRRKMRLTPKTYCICEQSALPVRCTALCSLLRVRLYFLTRGCTRARAFDFSCF